MRVPTCQLQHGFGADARGVVPYPAQRIELQQDAESFYGRRGVSILATCTPYQVGNIPVRGEHVAWMESSAVIYANSVLGARTNCEGTASSGAASLTGKIPCWGNHRDENRYGTHLIDVRTPVDSFLDWGTRLLGTAPIAMIITRISTKSALGAVVTRVPALTDLDQDPCAVIRTGDWVRVDATHGLIEVKPAVPTRGDTLPPGDTPDPGGPEPPGAELRSAGRERS